MPIHATLTAVTRTGGSVVDTDLLSQSSDLASRVIETESHKLKADRIHAAEARCAQRFSCAFHTSECTTALCAHVAFARRLSELSAEAQSAPRISKDHTERALQYMEFKARAEATLLAERELVKTVRHCSTHPPVCVCAHELTSLARAA